MILCSHNTMSYRRPKEWYLWPVRFMSQCQQCDYKTQHEKYGVNCFDLRLFWDKNGNVEFRHGGCSFDASDFNEILKYCEDEGILIRLLFEERKFPSFLKKRSKKMNLAQKFKDTCKWIEETYPNLKCYAGYNASDFGEKLYDFKYDNVYKVTNEFMLYSSMTSLFKSSNKFLKIIDDWYPKIYARRMNKKNRSYCDLYKDDDTKLIQFDFVDIQ